jgi:O-antigen ligase
MAVLMLVMGTLFAVVVPHSIMERYLTLFHAESQQITSTAEADQVGKAESSAAARWGKFILSLQLTVQHPIFGIGPGTFPSYVDSAARSEGHYSDWNGTHNSYTQISSEAGIPGLMLFVALLVLPVKGLSKVLRRAGKLQSAAGRDIANTAAALRDSLFAFMVCIWFDHVAYQLMMPILAALAIAVVHSAEVELPALEMAGGPKMEPAPIGHFNAAGRRRIDTREAPGFPGPGRGFGGAGI